MCLSADKHSTRGDRKQKGTVSACACNTHRLTHAMKTCWAHNHSEFSSPYRDMPLAVHTSFADLPCSPARGNATGRTSILSCYHPTGTEINPSPVSSDDLRHPPLVACAPATSSHGWHHHHHIMARRLMFTCPSAASPARPSAMVPHAYSCPGAPSPRGGEVISEVYCLLGRCKVWRMNARA